MPPAISLIIPAFNRAKYIAATIKSVLTQTRGDFELVIWDDGSTDDTLRVARETAGGDPRLRVVQSVNLGVPRAINAAAKLVSAPYFGWVDSDDLLVNEALARTSAILDANPNVGMVYTDYLSMDPSGAVKGLGHRCKIPYSKDRLLVNFMTFHFRLMRRELFDSVGQMDENLRYAEDYDLCLRLSEVTQIHHLPVPLYVYRVHGQSISRERRLQQIDASVRAIRAALERRKLADQYELEVEYSAKYFLKKRDAAGKEDG